MDIWPATSITLHIDATSPYNGFLRVVPGSHLWAREHPDVLRFEIRDEPRVAKPYRVCTASYERFISDFRPGGDPDHDNLAIAIISVSLPFYGSRLSAFS